MRLVSIRNLDNTDFITEFHSIGVVIDFTEKKNAETEVSMRSSKCALIRKLGQ